MDYNSAIIGFGAGLIAEKFFKITDKIKTAVKNYQKSKKANRENKPKEIIGDNK